MVDPKSQFIKIKNQIDTAIIKTIDSTRFINGPFVTEFSNLLRILLSKK